MGTKFALSGNGEELLRTCRGPDQICDVTVSLFMLFRWARAFALLPVVPVIPFRKLQLLLSWAMALRDSVNQSILSEHLAADALTPHDA